MATVENNILDPVKIKDKLFSKDTISNLNKQLLEKFNLTEINKDSKKKVIDILIKNMKVVYKSIDIKKITQKNFSSIFAQYNKLCFEQASADIGREEILTLLLPNASSLKFERDFQSNPNDGNKIMERPRGVSNRSQNSNSFLYPPNGQNSGQNKSDNRFDKLFKPIVDSVDDSYKFNNYQHGKGGDDFNKRVEQFMSERDTETIIPKRPNTPDFLKPIQTSSKSEIPQVGNRSANPVRGNGGTKPMPVQRKGGKPDFSRPIPEEEIDTGFLSLNENENDLYNINNIDKPIDVQEIQEDGRSFQERLKSLESERNNIALPKAGGKINFQDPDLVIDNDDVIPDYQPKSIEEIKREKDKQARGQRQEMMDSRRHDSMDSRRQEMMDPRRQDSMDSRRQEMIDPRRQDSMDSRRQEMMEPRRRDPNEPIRQLPQETILKPKQEPFLKQNLNSRQKLELEDLSRDDSIKMSKNPPINMKKVQDALKKIGMIDNPEISELKRENDLLKKQLGEKKEDKDDKHFDILKKDLANDFQKLYEKERIINDKEEEMKLLLKKYNYLYGVRHIQMDISPQNPVNDFVFEFPQVNNIIGVKLMSYSIPQPRYNIEENKNNIFKIESAQSTKEFKLNSGKYKIEDILSILSNKSNLTFELNYEQKVEISSKKKNNDDSEEPEIFDIVPTILSKEILGFVNNCSTKHSYVADRTWDLRIEDKIYLFINNIDETVPLGVLYLGNQAVQQFRFEEPVNLDRLELHFKDSKGRPFNFYGLTYSLNIQLEINDVDDNQLTLQ
jgi:hypothetical protein